MESVLDHERVAPRRVADIGERETRHRDALIELHGVTWNPVAEIMRPRQHGRRPIGEVVEAREEAADASDRDADRKRQRKARAGPPADAGAALVELDRDDPAGERAFDRAREAVLLREP